MCLVLFAISHVFDTDEDSTENLNKLANSENYKVE